MKAFHAHVGVYTEKHEDESPEITFTFILTASFRNIKTFINAEVLPMNLPELSVYDACKC